MLENVRMMFYSTLQFFMLEIHIDKYTFTFWQIFLFMAIATGFGCLMTAIFGGGEH